MKRLSEILKLSLQFHESFGGPDEGMCAAIWNCRLHSHICTDMEAEDASAYCRRFVKQIASQSSWLFRALENQGLPNDEGTIGMIWLAVIDKLESEGR